MSSPQTHRSRRPRGRPPHPDVLTPAEWRVLNWVRHGLARRAIAEQMGISENGVKYHIANIGSKLGVSGLRALRQWPGYPVDSPMTSRSTTMTTSRLGPLGQVSLFARDVARTEAFYRDTLGLPHIFTFGELAFFDCGGVRLYVHCVPDEKWQAGSVLYFRVDDIDASVRALTALGVSFTGQPHRVHRDEATGEEEWMAFFEDPDRNMLALMSRVSPAT